MHYESRTLGSLFAGIGGFDLGFERAGYRTAWQVEIDPFNRSVLAEQFPNARRLCDVREAGRRNLCPVEVLAAGFPCQDISNVGARRKNGGRTGLRGARSGLFWEVVRIIDEIHPRWVVLENVPALLHSNAGKDFAAVVSSLAERGFMGRFRVLDAFHFGVPQKRRRLYIVAGHHEMPPIELLSDAGAVETIPCTFAEDEIARRPDAAPTATLLADNARCRLGVGSEIFVAHEHGWDQMLERERASLTDGLPFGMDDAECAAAYSAGNAVVPQVAEWIARKLLAA
jgi:DNA (cytosine-5)-methyltransferase 1